MQSSTIPTPRPRNHAWRPIPRNAPLLARSAVHPARRNRRGKAALDSLSESIAVRERLVAEAPTDFRNRSNLSSSYQIICAFLLTNDRSPEARTWIEKALAIQEKLVIERPNSATLQKRLAASHPNLGNLEVGIGDPEGAVASSRRALKYFRGLEEVQPGEVEAAIEFLAE